MRIEPERKANRYLKNTRYLLIFIVVISLIPAVKWGWVEKVYWLAGIAVPLITLASVYLILGTFQVQQQQLQIQKNEIWENQKETKRQIKIMSLQRFENTFFLLLEQLNTRHDKVLFTAPRRFNDVKSLLGKEVSKAIKSGVSIDPKNYVEEEHLKRVIKAIYDGCMETERTYLGLGLGTIPSYFVQIIKLLIQSEKFLEDEEVRYYFGFITLEINEDVLYLLLYYIIYFDEQSVIHFLDKKDLVYRINSSQGPIDFSRERSVWRYIVKNAGNLDPYSVKKLLE